MVENFLKYVYLRKQCEHFSKLHENIYKYVHIDYLTIFKYVFFFEYYF